MSSYAFLNIFPGITSARYWSDATTLRPRQLITVLAKRPKILSAILNKTSVILDNAPMPSIIPPKTIAQQISRMVHIMPVIPPELKSSFKVSLVVVIAVSVQIAVVTAENEELDKPFKTSA